MSLAMIAPDEKPLWILCAVVMGAAALFMAYLVYDGIRHQLEKRRRRSSHD